MKRIARLLTPTLSGVAVGLTVTYFLPAQIEWAAMVPYLILLFHYDDRDDVKGSLWLGIRYFYPYYLTVFYWFLTMYPLDFTELSRAAAAVAVGVAWLGLPFLQAVVAMWQVWILRLAMKPLGGRRMLFPPLYGLVYIVFEWIQTLTWAGVPWGRLAVGQAYVPLMIETASWLGSYFVSFMIVVVNGYVAVFIVEIMEKRPRKAVLAAILAASVLAFDILSGIGINMTREEDDDGRRVSVGILQGNVSSKDKWSDGSFTNLSGIYGELTEAAADEGADVVLWTETSIPFVANRRLDVYSFIESLAMRNEVTLMATSFWEEGDGLYNAVYEVTPDGGINGKNIYYKRRLVPFGEYVPYENVVKALIPPLAEMTMFANPLSSGDSPCVHDTELGRIGSLVCFDSIYEEYALDAVKNGAELLTVSTNDSWFGMSAALYMHTAQAILRAVENDRYVARAGNTGYSCVISPAGEILYSIEPETKGYFVADVFMRDTETLYTRVGDAIIAAAAAIVIPLAAAGLIYNVKKKKKAHKAEGDCDEC